MAFDLPPSHHRATGLVDVLDRVLDKAQEIGLDWWRYDRELSPGGRRESIADHEELRAQIRQLEQRIAALAPATPPRRRK